MRLKLISIIIGIAALAFTGCESTANNANNKNTNTAVLNSNRAAATPTPVDCSKLTKEEYEKNKAACEKDKGSSTIGSGLNDSWIWFKVRAALAAADDLRDSTINVDVVDSVVTLKGTVASAAQKTSAEKVAKGIEGVKSVTNQLQVKPADSLTNRMVNGNSKTAAPTPKK